MNKTKIVFYGMAQALAVALYTAAVAWFFFNAERFFDKTESDKFWAPFAMLTLLVFSVALCGLLVFGRSLYCYLNGFKKESFLLAVSTLLWLFVFLLLTFSTRF